MPAVGRSAARGALTATIWNDTDAPVEATVAGRTVSLGPAAFEHVPLDER
jgi:hypothetical protein